MQLTDFNKIHLIGIKGAGMTALAEFLVHHEKAVSGSDTEEVFYTDAILARYKIMPHVGFRESNIALGTELVVYSTAYNKEQNTELAHALTLGIPVLSYPEAVGLITEMHQTLAVCGTHGKTTTSALLAHTLKLLGADPSAIIGSRIAAWGGSALLGAGKYFVLEADEYQNKLAHYLPFGVILTSVDYDHPDFFPTVESYTETFETFVKRIPRHGFLVACSDSSDVNTVASQAICRTLGYGFVAGADYQITDWQADVEGEYRQRFELIKGDENLGSIELRLAGRHNALNATAVIALLLELGFEIELNTEKC